MMDYDQLFPGRFVKAGDLGGKDRTLADHHLRRRAREGAAAVTYDAKKTAEAIVWEYGVGEIAGLEREIADALERARQAGIEEAAALVQQRWSDRAAEEIRALTRETGSKE